MDKEKTVLTKQEAIEMLPEGEKIHVFMNPNGMLLGADWTRQQVLELINGVKKENYISLAGEQATRMKHGLVVWDGNRYCFIQTKDEKQ